MEGAGPTPVLDTDSRLSMGVQASEGSVEERASEGVVVEQWSRPLGYTEENWTAAVSGGTGNTVLAVLLRRSLDVGTVQRAVDAVLQQHPRARSHLSTTAAMHPLDVAAPQTDKPAFCVPKKSRARVREVRHWQPRESMELNSAAPAAEADGEEEGAGGQGGQSEEVKEVASIADRTIVPVGASEDCEGDGAGSVLKITTCFEIGRRSTAAESTPKAGHGTATGRECGGGSVGEFVRSSSGQFKLSLCREKWLQIVESNLNEEWCREEEQEPQEEEEEEAEEEHEWHECGEEICSSANEQREDEQEQSASEQGPTEVQGKSTAGRGGSHTAGRGGSHTRASTLWSSSIPLLRVLVYTLPSFRTLLLIRAHTAACDRVSAAVLIGDLLHELQQQLHPHATTPPSAAHSPHPSPGVPLCNGTSALPNGCASEAAHSNCSDEEGAGAEAGPGEEGSGAGSRDAAEQDEEAEQRRLNPECVEDCVPGELKRKPFWAHGIDVLGYGLGSRRHACLPFQDTHTQRRSELIRSGLSRPDTDLLLQACEREGTSLHGVLSAAVLKAAAKSKALGKKAEHFAVTSLLDLRPYLGQYLHSRTVGFYHSALLSTHHVSETTALWDLARRCHESVTKAVAHRKHFTDMGDLNLLMAQAMEHPQLTPSGSLRTSMLCSFTDALKENMEPYAVSLDVEDYIGCSSVHGVGPCIAVFDSLREDGLHMANVFPAPLFSRSQMRCVITATMELLHDALNPY